MTDDEIRDILIELIKRARPEEVLEASDVFEALKDYWWDSIVQQWSDRAGERRAPKTGRLCALRRSVR